ncbi:MAG: DUF2029 domain-containing protein [Solirubrobacteraceae bacterium]|nr:DUF2029 domain-containing protein [Solirubrobacteraceae bacterium]
MALSRLAPYAALTVGFALLATILGPLSDTRVSDLYLYGQYAQLLHDGQLPYLDFGFEYPPLGIVPIAVASLAGHGDGGTGGGFDWLFGGSMLVCALAGQWAAAALARETAGQRAETTVAWLMAAQPVLIGASLRTHFDLLPVAVTVFGLLLLVRERPVAGMAALAIGTMIKLFPAILAVAAVVWLVGRGQARAAVRGAAAFSAIVLILALPFAGDGLIDMLRFHLERPVQIESTPATLLFASGGSEVTGTNLRPDRFKSNGLDGGSAHLVGTLFALLQIAAIVAAVALAFRRPDGRWLGLCCIAALLAFIALGKVLSPQYMIWLAPFAALAWVWGERAVAAMCAGAIALTSVWFPNSYLALVQEADWVIWTVALRNALLVGALLTLLVRLSVSAPSTADSDARVDSVVARSSPG